MLNLDPNGLLGQRALERLQRETNIWLTTVSKDGTPFPKPVWFWWDDEAILIYSQPNALAVKHLGRGPRVSVNFDRAGGPGGVLAMTGSTTCLEIDPGKQEAAFLAKYAAMLPTLRANYGEDFAALYTVLIRVVPDRLMGH